MQNLRSIGKAEAYQIKSWSWPNLVWHTLSHSTCTHHNLQTINPKFTNYTSKSPEKSQEQAYKISCILAKESRFHD